MIIKLQENLNIARFRTEQVYVWCKAQRFVHAAQTTRLRQHAQKLILFKLETYLFSAVCRS